LIKKFSFLVLGIFILSSCGELKGISWKSGDPWGDENVTVEKKNSKKSIDEDIPDIYERSTNLSIDEADLMIRSELESRNIKIIHVLYISRGIEEQGYKDFWKDMRIYLACNLSSGYVIFKHNPQLVGLFPCRMYTYRNKEGKLVIGMVKPSLAIKYMGNPDLEAIKLMKKLDETFKEIVDTIAESE
jgi:uncharacterized protein (DUF302 family)